MTAGINTRFRTGGSWPSVLLLHSLALDHGVWADVIPRIASQSAVIAPDLRGHGASPAAFDGMMIEDMAADLPDLVRRLGGGRVVVVGMSMGGCVAQAFAVHYPELVAGLVLADTTAWYGPDAQAAWEDRAQRAMRDGLDSLSQFQLDRWFTPAFLADHPATGARLLEVFCANRVEDYAAACRALGAFDGRERLAEISMPAAVLVGESDAATPPPHARDLAERISAASLEMIEHCAHISAVEQPDPIAAAINQIVWECASGWTS